jgi:MFS family permease
MPSQPLIAAPAADPAALADHLPRSLRAALAWRLPKRLAFHLLASVTLFLLAGSSAMTPLYAHYQAAWGYSPITTTMIFATYAVSVLAGLLTMGSLSDHIGRRPVLLAALVAQIAIMVIFATADGVTALFVGRILQGISTGAAVAAVGAGLLDLDRATGTIANGVGPMLGTATGALLSALLVRYLPAPTHLVYLLLAGIFALQVVGVALIRETVTPRAGALSSLRPRLNLPASARRPLLVAAPALIAAWSIAGFYGSLGPGLIRIMTGAPSILYGGLALFLLAVSGAATVFVMRNVPAATVLARGTIGLALGALVSLIAIRSGNVAVLGLGTVISGIGFGAAFQGAVRTVLPHAAAHERAGTLAVVFVISYLAMGLPTVAAGTAVVYGGGLLATAQVYVLVSLALAMSARTGLYLSTRPAHRVSYRNDLVAQVCEIRA